MKFLIILSAVAAVKCQFPQWQQLANTSQLGALSGVDLPGAAISQLSTLTKQLEGLQGVLQSLSQQFSSMVRTSTRLVEGLQSDISNPMTGLTDTFNSMVSTMNQLTSQFSLIQRTLSEVTSNLQRMVTSSTRIIGGNPMYQAEPWNNVGNTILGSLEDATRQIQSTASVLRDLNSSWSRLISSGSRLVSGLQDTPATAAPATPAPPTKTDTGTSTGTLSSSQTTTNTTTITQGMGDSGTGSGPVGTANNAFNRASNPTETILKASEALTEQMGAAQKIAGDLSQQLSKLVQTAGKVVTGNRDLSPIEAGLNSLSEMTQQFAQFQNVLRSLNNQFNRMLESGTKMIGGDTPALYANSLNQNHLGGRADRVIIEALQASAAQVTRQLGQLGATMARIAGGATGVRALGGGSTPNSRGSFDTLSNLNPLAAIGRQVGNIAGSLTRILPTSG